MSTETEFRITSNPRSPRPRRLLPIMIGVAAVVALATAIPAQAQADGLSNAFFKAQPELSGWQSSGTASPSYLQSQNIFCDVSYCQPETGAPVAVAGMAGSPAPKQKTILGTAGRPGHSFRYTSTFVDGVNPDGTGKSNFAMVFGGCNANAPDTGRLYQSFDVVGGDVLTGWSFFSSADWWPDSGAVKIIAPDGSAATVFQSEIADGQAPAGPWDHPVPGTPNNRPDLIGQSGTGWVKWDYQFPQTGTYKLEVSSTNAQDCNGPSAVGLQFKTPDPITKGQAIDFATQDKTYGDADFGVSATAKDARTGDPTGLAVTFSNSTPSVCALNTSSGQVQIIGAGDCQITASQAGNGTYAPATVTRTIHIAKAPLSINANDQSKQYGASDPTLTYGLSGFVNGEGQGSAGISGSASCAIAPAAGPNAGGYPGAISCAPGSLSADDYSFQTGSLGALTITKANQSIDFSAATGKAYGDADFDPAATATSGLAVSYSSSTPGVCTIVGGKVHVVSPGDCTVIASQPGSGNYNSAPDVTRTLAVGKAAQSIDFSPLSGKTFGDPDVSLGATATSGLPVSYTSSTPSVCTIVGGSVHIVGVGDCTVVASQSGNGNYQAAQDVTRTFAVAKADQTVTLPAPVGKTYGDSDLAPGATAGSGLQVSYTSETPGVCSIVNGKVHILGAGDCTITAAQAGSANYNAAPAVSKTFTVGKAPLAVNAGNASKQYGGADPSLTNGFSGFVNGDGQGSANISGNADCSIAGGAGPNVGTYAQAITCGPGTLSAANYSFQAGSLGTLTITKADQAVDFSAPSGMTFGDPDVGLGATASSGLPVSYSSSTPSVCTVSGGQVHVVGAGTCTLTASQPGNGNFNAAQNVTRSFDVAKVPQAIDLATPSGLTATSGDFDPHATAGSGLPVSYSSSTPGVCTIVNGKVHILTAGECTISAAQAGNGNYDAADNASVTFTVAKVDQSITFTAPASKAVGSPDLDPAAGATSSLTTTYTSSTPGVCTIVNGKIHFVAAGDCSITASQPGNGNYNAAQDVTRTFAVTKPTVPPTVAIATAADGASYYQYQTIKADYSCQAAAGVGLASCNGDVNVGSPIDTSTPGAHNLTVTAKDTAGNQASKTVKYTVIPVAAPQGGGVFAIGDKNAIVGNKVTYWGSQWWKQNTLSGGTGPSDFKGYIDSAKAYPPACGDGWTTRPGNSSKPPDQVPAYMAVVATGNVDKSGSTISGDSPQIVVVKTDSGYDSNPGHAGTGTVVAKLCGDKLNQAIDFTAPSSKTLQDADFDPGASANSGLAVVYSSSTPSVCTIVGGKIDIVGTGNCTVTASQPGNDNYSAAQDVTRTFAVNAAVPVCINGTPPSGSKVKCESLLVNPTPGATGVTKAGQTMTIGYTDEDPIGTGSLAPSAQLSNGQTLPVTVTPTSGQPLNYVTNFKRDYTTKNQSLIRFSLPANLAPGNYSVLVSAYDGDGDLDQWNWPITVVAADYKADQAIDFTAPSSKTVGDADFAPGATSNSSLPVGYTSSTPTICTVTSDGKVHVLAAGTCAVTASQAGNDSYKAAQSVSRSFTVNPQVQPPTVTIRTPADGASYYQGQSVKADYSCQAATGATLASCVGNVQAGSSIDTSAAGTKSFTVTAKDSAGNQTKKTVTYTVIGVGGCRGGAFVIGDKNADVGSKVTFWGSQWSKQNSLSGGSAPSSFKGFADSEDSDSSHWGSSWTTRTGNASSAPDSIPTYMAVIVSSNVRQSGSTIGGDAPKVVVVKTDSGYDSNPGHAGTGTVVAKLSG